MPPRSDTSTATGTAGGSGDDVDPDDDPRTIDCLSTLASALRMRGDTELARLLDARLRAYWASAQVRPLLLEDDESDSGG